MTAAILLETLRTRGARLEVLPGDCLAVTPRSALDDQLRAAIRREKPALVRLLTSASPTPARAAYATRHEPPVEAAVPVPTAGAWRVIVEHCEPLPGPVQLDACTVVFDSARCTERTLIDLERAIAHKNAGRASAYTELIEQYVERLAACGCRARVEPVQ